METGAAAKVGFREKMRKYGDIAEQNNLQFLPIVFESTGYLHEKAVAFLREAAGMTERNKSIDVINRYNYLMTNISVVLQRGLAQAFLQGKQRVQGGLDKPVIRSIYSRSTISEFAHVLRRNGCGNYDRE